eukprot:TRINITY_DN1145_c0_g1_i1.p1 TRINITY_DN1145_c0_g1~~TRINITY_DN1145_c0_g1_i1.p1  ORF type:complete len:128 (+),score=43.83 TRINITY_DN1145_c0_g1_i1:50-433(+)
MSWKSAFLAEQKDVATELQNVFKKYDSDNSSAIDAKEMKPVVKDCLVAYKEVLPTIVAKKIAKDAQEATLKASLATIEKLIVDYEAFATKIMDILDTSKDGSLQADEFVGGYMTTFVKLMVDNKIAA